MIEPDHTRLSIRRQCELIGISRSSLSYEPAQESDYNLLLMQLLDEQYTRTPFYGVLKMTAWLREEKQHLVTHKRVRRLLRLMGLEAIYPKPRLSMKTPGHQIYPYLLRGVAIDRVNKVWSTDITYVRLVGGFVYLVAIIDWYSRYVLSWEVSIKARNSRVRRLPGFSKSTESRSVWTDAVEPWTISSWRGSGAVSNTKMYI
jgi:putative transposase